MKQILLILQCQRIIWLNTVTIILILQKVYGAEIELSDEIGNNASVTNGDNQKIHQRIAWFKLLRSQKIVCSCLW